MDLNINNNNSEANNSGGEIEKSISTVMMTNMTTSFLNSGWRPLIGWMCLLGFTYQFVALPLLSWGSTGWWHVPPPPGLDVTQLIALLGATGTMAGLRTVERLNKTIPPGK